MLGTTDTNAPNVYNGPFEFKQHVYIFSFRKHIHSKQQHTTTGIMLIVDNINYSNLHWSAILMNDKKIKLTKNLWRIIDMILAFVGHEIVTATEKTRTSNHLQMSLHRQHILLSYFKILSVGPLWGSNPRPPVLLSDVLPTELTGWR